MGWNLQNTYASLPKAFFTPTAPTPVAAPRMVLLNQALATELGLDTDKLLENGARIFSGNELPVGSFPIAQAYAGHQYGHFTMLGDGRAILLGEQLAPSGALLDVQLKGSGPTAYSRQGDGRAALGPMLREYLISEAMHALGIPSTRSLAVVATGESVLRQDGLTPGGILTRISASHVRVGTFEWAARAGGPPALRALIDFTLKRHFPDQQNSPEPARDLLQAVVEGQSSLIAKWMQVGFVHGVMNTDNMALSGETIDYGPCAFMDHYHPATVFSSIDRNGRYAYANQPSIAQWNLARFAETLLPLLHANEKTAIDIAMEIIESFTPLYQENWLSGMRRKLGLFNAEPEDLTLVTDLLQWMQETRQDFTNTFAGWNPLLRTGEIATDDLGPEGLRWREAWLARLVRQTQSVEDSQALRAAHNPAVIPRNHRVEEALAAAIGDDLQPMLDLLKVLTRPYDAGSVPELYRQPAPEDLNYVTYCGT
jgi:serine/tyrosine/threonine adenylyltransferase